MQQERPCCPAAAARMIKRIRLPSGFEVGIVNLEKVLKEAAELKLPDEEAIRKELVDRVKVYNYVASGAEADYATALLEEYKKLFGKR